MNKRGTNILFGCSIGIVFLLGIIGIQNLREKVDKSINKIQSDLESMEVQSGYLDTLEIIRDKLNQLEAQTNTVVDPKVSKREKQAYMALADTIRALNLYCQKQYNEELNQEELFVLTEDRLNTWGEIMLEVNDFDVLDAIVGELLEEKTDTPSQKPQGDADAEEEKLAFFKWVFSKKYRKRLQARRKAKNAPPPEKTEPKEPPKEEPEPTFSQKQLDRKVASVRRASQNKMGKVVGLFYDRKNQAQEMDAYLAEIRSNIETTELGAKVENMKKRAKDSLYNEFDFFIRLLTILGSILMLTLIGLVIYYNFHRRQIEKREEFVSKVSHEIKNALHPIIGYAGTLGKTITNPDSRRIIWTIKEESQHLLHLATGILDLSKITRSEFKLDKSPFLLLETLNQVVSGHYMEADRKGIKLEAKFDSNLPKAVMGDPVRLKQIIRNLLGNAINHTDQGKVMLGVTLIRDSRKKALIEFNVVDTGKGLSRKDLRKIARFRRFFSIGDGSKGHGLGLAISNQLVRQHRGRMKIRSKGLGKGVQVQVRIPYLVCSTQEVNLLPDPQTLSTPMLSGKKMLVIDDDRLNLELTSMWLQSWGAIVEIAVNGKDAQKILASLSVDLILADLHMPVVDGVGFIKWLREKKRDSTPVIVCSAGSVGDILERAKESGANDFLAKPYKQEELAEKITQYLGGGWVSTTEENKVHKEGDSTTANAVEKLQQELKGNQAAIDKKIRLLIEVCRENVAVIKKGIRQQDGKKVNRAVHKMLMICLYLGKDFVERQADLEDMTRNGKWNAATKSLTKEFVKKVEAELVKLEAYTNYSKLPS